MKKKVTVLALMLCLTSPTALFAATTETQENTTVKMAFVQDVLKDVIKNTLYGVGTNMLNRITNPYNYNYNYNTNPSNGYYNYNTGSNGVQYNTNTNLNTSGDYIPGQDPPPEPMIPVS